MRKSRAALLGLAALPLSQFGHALATRLAGQGWAPAAGAHAYYPALLQSAGAAAGAAMLAAGLALALARVFGGPRLRSAAGLPVPIAILGLAALQSEIYVVQELLEGSNPAAIAAGGLAGQVPVAVAGGIILALLSSRIGPALQRLRAGIGPALDLRRLPSESRPASILDSLHAGLAGVPARGRGPPPALPVRS